MMTSYFNLLKYAATGIASPDMTYYDRMRASTLMGGVVQTLTGQPPLSFKSDGSPLISWSMLGNGQQQGTPTPDNQVMPEFVGVRTGNLFDITAFVQGIVPNRCTTSYDSTTNTLTINPTSADAHTGNNNTYHIPVTGGETYSLSWQTSSQGGDVYIFENGLTDSSHLHLWNSSLKKGTITMRSDTTFIIVRVGCYAANVSKTYTNICLYVGSKTQPYEPYGWTIPLTCAGQTIPVYLGEVPTVRRIKKLVLTGEENIEIKSGNAKFYIPIPDMVYPSTSSVLWMCSHYKAISNAAPWTSYDYMISWSTVDIGASFGLRIRDINYISASAADFKAYLAAQYANGTPVTIWYVLSSSATETGIVNEPLCKISTSADELSSEDVGVSIPTIKGQNTLTVDTPIQPSEMTITFKG